ncbi:MAG: hypothetical protein LBJ67_04965 [Planctomycetaceae bacterium]|jgi:HrpA-like RNA helicase|nr:hypothetical protein [Planctomycetaceae bacterium]
MGREWKCICKDCGQEFSYSNTKYETGLVRGWSRPERCDNCRAQHAREIQSIGQPFYKVKTLRPITDPKKLTSDLGRFDRADRPHEIVEILPKPIDPDKFGIKDDRIVELFHFFKQDPGLQVVVIVGPTGSGKSTYFPYRLVELPTNYKDSNSEIRDQYWTVPIETDEDLQIAQSEIHHTILCKGVHRHYTYKPDDLRTETHEVSGKNGLDRKLFHRYGQIVVTQPRIQATRNIPDFIARAMMGCSLGAGHDIGFRHSGSPNSDWSSKLAFVTDGTLINWLSKGELDKINTVMIDEAHERSLNIDIIIGLLTQLLPRYPRLKLIIASATISADKFINHFNKYLPQRYDVKGNLLPNCRFIEFEGKSFKVTPHFRRVDEKILDYFRSDLSSTSDGISRWEGRHKNPNEMYQHVAKKAVEILRAMYDTTSDGGYLIDHTGEKIDMTERQGDILGFLHGEVPIQNCCKQIEKDVQEILDDNGVNVFTLVSNKNDEDEKENQDSKCSEEKVPFRALPLYTTLSQNEQDEALKEREQPDEKLRQAITLQLEKMITQSQNSGDILAILNNAGQIYNLCNSLERQFDMPTIKIDDTTQPNPLYKKIKFIPWFTPETAHQLFETMPERASLIIPPPESGMIRVVISTNRHRNQLSLHEFPYVIELPPQERRVVVSTNVAETSLTIHGILHVVDCGLINQSKWDSITQTSAVSPILQSRAGCKQRWGRAGRLQAGDAWLLYTEEQFGKEPEEENPNAPDLARCFDYYSCPEISRSPLEQVLLTAKKSGVENLHPEQFPWLDPPDIAELERSHRNLEKKGALDTDGDVTEHGLELGNMQNDINVGNMLIVADRFSCVIEMSAIIAVGSAKNGKGLRSLFVYDKQWDDYTKRQIQNRHKIIINSCKDDLDVALKLFASWEKIVSIGQNFIKLVQYLLHKTGNIIDNIYNESKEETPIRKIIDNFYNTPNEALFDQLVEDLLNNIAESKQKRDIQAVVLSYLTTYNEFRKNIILWKTILHLWALPIIWKECITKEISKDNEELQSILSELISCDNVEDIWRLIQQLKDFEYLTYSSVLNNLPLVLAEAWAKSYYIDVDTFLEVVTKRNEMLTPFESHKKGDEYRCIDLSRNDRLRVLFAYCLPNNMYRSKNNEKTCVPLLPNLGSEELDFELDDISCCNGQNLDIFICYARRSLQGNNGSQRLFASFIVRLPEQEKDILCNIDNPFHKISHARLVRFISESCCRDMKLGNNLIIDQIFPPGAQCDVEIIESICNSNWRVKASLPTEIPGEIEIRNRRALDGEQVSLMEDVIITSSINDEESDGMLLSDYLRTLKAGTAIEESIGLIEAPQWENMFASTELTDDNIPNTLIQADLLISKQLSNRSIVEFDGILLSTDPSIELGKVLKTEVIQSELLDNGTLKPYFKYPMPPDEFIKFSTVQAENFKIGNIFDMVVCRVENLLFSSDTLLIAREKITGYEVKFSAEDLSFYRLGIVPNLLINYLPPGSEFKAKLIQIDPETSQLKMTTHHVYSQLFPDPQVLLGKQRIKFIYSDSFVQILTDESPEKQGFLLLANIRNLSDEFVFGGESIANISLPNRTIESWMQDVNKPEELTNGDDSKIRYDKPIPENLMMKWLSNIINQDIPNDSKRFATTAIFNLYLRSNQLRGISQQEFSRLEDIIGKIVIAKVLESNSSGLKLSISDYPDTNVWMSKNEYSWFGCEDFAIGAGIQVKVLDVDYSRLPVQINVSRKGVVTCPINTSEVGKLVTCRIVSIKDNGAMLMIKLEKNVRGWVYWNNLVQLPYERDIKKIGAEFGAIIKKIDIDRDQIEVSRWSLFQCLLHDLCGEVTLSTDGDQVINEQKDRNEAIVLCGKIYSIEEKGMKIELAPNIIAWMPKFENSYPAENWQIGDLIEVVLMPRRNNDPEHNIWVSRRRYPWCQEFSLTGELGLFFGPRHGNIEKIKKEILGWGSMISLGRDPNNKTQLVLAENEACFHEFMEQLTLLANSSRCDLLPIGQLPKRTSPQNLCDLNLSDSIRNG